MVGVVSRTSELIFPRNVNTLATGPVTVPLGPAVVHVTGVRAGDRNEFTMTFTSGGVPLDLTPYTITAQARRVAQDLGPAACDAVVIVTDAANGALLVRWPGDQVRTMLGDAGEWEGVWDLQLAPVTGDPVTIAAGSLTAVSDVTR